MDNAPTWPTSGRAVGELSWQVGLHPHTGSGCAYTQVKRPYLLLP
jgi:hypothetical protein